MPNIMRSCLRHSSFYVLRNSFHLPDLSSDLSVRQLPKLAPLFLEICYGMFAEKQSVSRLSVLCSVLSHHILSTEHSP